jgi:hypothetical protein
MIDDVFGQKKVDESFIYLSSDQKNINYFDFDCYDLQVNFFLYYEPPLY